MAQSRVGRDAGEAVGAAALQPDVQGVEGRGLAAGLVGNHQAGKRLAQRGADEGVLSAQLLLVKNVERLAEIGVALRDFLLQHAGLRILAAQAEYSGAGHVGVRDVAGQQAAQRLRILPDTAATALVREKPDAVHVRERALALGHVFAGGEVGAQDFLHRFAGLHQAEQLAGFGLVALAALVAQVRYQGIFQHLNVAVFAEYQRDNQPVVGRAHAAVGAVVALEGAVLPAAHVGRLPGGALLGVLVVAVGGVLHVGRGEAAAGANVRLGLAHEHAVHSYGLARLQAQRRELVLGRNGLGGGYKAVFPGHLGSDGQVDEGDEHVIGGVNAGYLVFHCSRGGFSAGFRGARPLGHPQQNQLL